MRKLCFLFVFLTLAFFVHAQNLPQPSGWVNDFAGVISVEYKEKLNSLISELEEKTSTEIAVVTIDSIAPYDEKAYARLLFDNWKPGKKGKDNGVLVLLAIKERRWRIETGYGIEGILPDGLCGEIGRNYMVSNFKQGKYSEGLYNGVVAIAQVIAKDAKVDISNLKGVRTKILTQDREDLKYKIFALIFGLASIFFLNWFYFLVGVGIIWVFFGFPTGKSFFIFFGILSILRYLFLRFIRKPRFNQNITWRDYWGGYGGGGSGGGGFGGGGFGGFGGGGGGGGGAGGGF